MPKRTPFAVAFAALLLTAAVPRLHAQSQDSEARREAAREDAIAPWKLVNTALFFALIGWGIAKKGPAFFNARSADIQRAIQEATGLKMHADLRYSEIDRKMATLSEEVKKIEAEAAQAMQRERTRIQEDTADEIRRIHNNREAEIVGLRYEATQRIQRQTAQAALRAAETDLAGRAGSQQDAFVDDFVRLVGAAK